MRIEISLDYMSDSVVCFDPEKIIWKLQEQFPEIVVDEKDYADAEIQSLITYLKDKGEEVSEAHKSQMLASIKRKTRQNGPAFIFRLDADNTVVSGWVRRYQVGFKSEAAISEELQARIVRFLKELEFGEVSIS